MTALEIANTVIKLSGTYQSQIVLVYQDASTVTRLWPEQYDPNVHDTLIGFFDYQCDPEIIAECIEDVYHETNLKLRGSRAPKRKLSKTTGVANHLRKHLAELIEQKQRLQYSIDNMAAMIEDVEAGA